MQMRDYLRGRRLALGRSIEWLEERVAPAVLVNPTTVTYLDSDGDTVTVHTTKGTFNLAQNFHFTPAGGGELLQRIELSNMHEFQGATITVMAGGGSWSDGHVDVGCVLATNVDLGGVVIDGDLGRVSAGDVVAKTPGLGKLQVESLGARGVTTQEPGGSIFSGIVGKLGKLNVAHDFTGATISVFGDLYGSIGNVHIGGDLHGAFGANSGALFSQGNIGAVKVDGNIFGSGPTSGRIDSGGSIASVTVGADVRGDAGAGSGVIQAQHAIGPVKIGGDLIGGPGDDSGTIRTVQGGKIASVTIAGSFAGGGGDHSGRIRTDGSGNIGPVRIGTPGVSGGMAGGPGDDSGGISTKGGGNIASVTIFGNLNGTAGDDTGSIQILDSGNIGPVKITGWLRGLTGARSGFIHIDGNGSIASINIGGDLDGGGGVDSGSIRTAGVGNIGPVSIGGEIDGGSNDNAGSVQCEKGSISSVTVHGRIFGGSKDDAGAIVAELNIGSVNLLGTGSLVGGSGSETGAIISRSGDINSVKIGGQLNGGTGVLIHDSGVISAPLGKIGTVNVGGGIFGGDAGPGQSVANTGAIIGGNIGSVSIHGDLQSGVNSGGLFLNSGVVEAVYRLGSLTVQGNVVGNPTAAVLVSGRGQVAPGGGVDSAIGNVHIHGNASLMDIYAGYVSIIPVNPDAQIGSVKVDGNWTAGNIVAGVIAVDGIFGNAGDARIAAPLQDTASIVSRIGSIIIGGSVSGTIPGGDGFGFVAEQIGSVKIGATQIALTPGAHNDLAPVGVPSSTPDVHVLEVP